MGSKSVWTDCKTCSKKISVSARTCPHCGAQQSKYRFLKWFAVGAVVLAVLGAIVGGREHSSQEAQPVQWNQVPSANSAVVELPEQQQRFLAITKDFAERFASAKNELQQSVLRRERSVALRDTLDSQRTISGWTGTIRALRTNTEGRAILTVRLSQNTEITTHNNAFSDLLDNTLIDQGTPLFNALMNMSVGDKVAVSGSFIPSDDDWIGETSVTIRGSMTDPAFLVRFQVVSKQ